MPTYYTPPPTPPSTRFPARSGSFSPSTPLSRTLSTRSSTNTSSSSPSTSRSSATTASSHRLAQRLGLSKEDEAAAKKKIPYVFLGSIAAASVLAHKYWPKGFPHGDKEDWELSKWALRAKHKRAEAKREKEAARRGEVPGSRHRSGDGVADEGYYSYGYDERELPHGRGQTGGYHTSGRTAGERVEVEEYAYGYTDDAREWDAASDRRGSVASRRARSRSRDRGYPLDRYAEPTYRRATSRERTELVTKTERYYPPASKRYLLERSGSVTGSSSAAGGNGAGYFAERRTRMTGSGAAAAPQLRYYDEEWPGEVVYARREQPGRSRRASFDAGAVRQYEREYEWDYR